MEQPRRRSSLGIIFLTIFVDLVSFSIIFPLFPRMLEYYLGREGSEGVLGHLIQALSSLAGDGAGAAAGAALGSRVTVLFGGVLGSVYSLLQFLFAPFWGSLSDRTGRRRVLLVTIWGITLSYALWFFSGSFALLVAARFLGGIMGGNISVATAAVADSTTREDRAKGMGVIGVAFGLGFILGPAMGGFLSRYDLTAAAPSLAAFGVNPFSAVAAAAMTLSAFNFLWVLTRFEETLREEDRGRAREERRTSDPLKLLRPVDLPGVNVANLVWFIYLTAFAGMEFTLAFLAADRYHYPPAKMSYLFVFSGLIIAFVQGGLIRQLAPAFGERKVLLAGLGTVIPGFVLTGLAPEAREGVLYLGLGLMALGSGLVTPTASSLVSLYTPPDRQGAVLGIFRSLGSLARAVGPILACALYWRFGAAPAYLAGAALLVLPLGLAFRLPAPHKA